jgi:tetratricopeptide (TPR) repeat protein
MATLSHRPIRRPGAVLLLVSLAAAAIGMAPIGAAAQTSSAAGQPGIEAVVDRTETTITDPLMLSITVHGSQEAQPTLPELPNFQLLSAGSARQMTIVNGVASVSVSYNYRLLPTTTGTFEVGPASVEIDGRRYSSKPFTIRVLPADADPQRAEPDDGGSAERDIFIVAQVSDHSPYLGEQVVYTWRLYRRVRIAEPQVTALEFPECLVEDLGNVAEYETTYQGRRFLVSEFKKAIFPQRTGTLTLPPSRLSANLLVQGRRSVRGRSMLDDFFGRQQMQAKVFSTAPIELNVRPLPPAPADFSGLLGRFEITSDVSRTELKVGESTTLKVTVSGRGNAQMIALPSLPDFAGFKVYEDKPVRTLTPGKEGLSGRKTYTRDLVPLSAGDFTLPAVSLTYFDPDSGGYRTTSTAPLMLAVSPSDDPQDLRLTESLAPTTGKVSVRILADDILPIYRGLDALARQRPAALVANRGDAAWLLGLALPPLAFVLLVALDRRRRLHASDRGLKRRKAALRTALRGLREVADLEQAGRAAEACHRAAELLRGYVGDKLTLESGALTAADVDAHLRRSGVEESLVEQTHRLLARLEAVRYSGGDASGGALAEPLGNLLRQLDSQIRRPRGRGGRRAALGLALAWLALAPVAGAATAQNEAPPAADAPDLAPPATDSLDADSIDLQLPHSASPSPAAQDAQDTDDATTPPPPPVDAAPAPADAGSDPSELFFAANQAYAAGEYAHAVSLYEQLLAAGTGGGHVYYDLGNAYLRSGQLGRAIASYLRARTLLPRDQDIAANLSFARRSTRNDLAPPAPSPLLRTLFFWHYSLSRGELLRLLVLANLLLWGALALRRWRRDSELLRWLAMATAVAVLALGASLAMRVVQPARVAVVVPQEIDAHSGNDDASLVRFKLQAGAELRALEQRGGWWRIALPDGQQGWIRAEHVEIVDV